jgi:hypothetical protein
MSQDIATADPTQLRPGAHTPPPKPHSPVSGNSRNRISKLFELMKEWKSIEAMNRTKMQIRKGSRGENRIRISLSTVSGND